jgi:hypothetical protein
MLSRCLISWNWWTLLLVRLPPSSCYVTSDASILFDARDQFSQLHKTTPWRQDERFIIPKAKLVLSVILLRKGHLTCFCVCVCVWGGVTPSALHDTQFICITRKEESRQGAKYVIKRAQHLFRSCDLHICPLNGHRKAGDATGGIEVTWHYRIAHKILKL